MIAMSYHDKLADENKWVHDSYTVVWKSLDMRFPCLLLKPLTFSFLQQTIFDQLHTFLWWTNSVYSVAFAKHIRNE